MEHAEQAASSLAGIRALLNRVAEITRPGEGCPKILIAIARLSGQTWVEGELRIELAGDSESTTLAILCEYGFGICERLFPMVRFQVPFQEFERYVEVTPELVLPLTITHDAGTLVLTASFTPDLHADAPPEFEVDLEGLDTQGRTTAPPPPEERPVAPVDDDANWTGNVHTRPTVRRMVAVVPAAIAPVQRRDPRREED